MTSMTMNNPHMNTLGQGQPPPPAPSNRKAVFVLTEKMTPEGQRTFWTRVGAAFENKDGSVTVKLDALPLSGTLQIREDDRDATRRDRVSHAPF